MKNTDSQSKAQAYAEKSKLKRKVLEAIDNKEDDEKIILEIVAAGYSNTEAKRMFLETKMERTEDRMRRYKNAGLISLLIVLGAMLLLWAWGDLLAGSRLFVYLAVTSLLPVFWFVLYMAMRLEKTGIQTLLQELDSETK